MSEEKNALTESIKKMKEARERIRKEYGKGSKTELPVEEKTTEEPTEAVAP